MTKDGMIFIFDFLTNPQAYKRVQEEDINQQSSIEERDKHINDLFNKLSNKIMQHKRGEKDPFIENLEKERKNRFEMNKKDPYLDLINYYLDKLKKQKNKQEENKENKRKIILEEFNRFLDNYIGFDYQWDEEKALDEIAEIEFEIKNVHGVETEFSLRLEHPKRDEAERDEEMFSDWDIVDITFEPYWEGTKLQWRTLYNFMLEALTRVVMWNPKKQTKIDNLMKKNLMKKNLLN